MESKHFSCAGTREQLVDWLSNQLPEAEREGIDAHLAQCPACRQELAALQQVWQTMGLLPAPAPSEQLRPRFYAMLAGFQAEAQREPAAIRFMSWLRQQLAAGPALRLAYTLLVLGVGLALGYGLSYRSQRAQQAGPASLAADSESSQQQQVVLALLENPSATQRLRGVSSTRAIGQVNQEVLGALLSTLNNDPNVNVRLATLDALAVLGEDPVVRQGLVHSLTMQESPLVQSALADVMVQLQVRRSVKPLRQLLRQANLNEAVKTKIENSIQTLSHGRSTDPLTPSQNDESRDQPQPDSPDTVAA
jgi:hypothetical protein